MNRVFEIISYVVRVLQSALLFVFLSSVSIFSQSQWRWQHPLPEGNTLNSVEFTNEKTGYAAGDIGSILKTTDGGKNWEKLSSGTDNNIHKIKFLNTGNGIAAGKNGVLMRTTDGGRNWKKVTDISMPDIHDIDIADYNYFICGLNGFIMRSADSGKTWTSINAQTGIPLFCISFLDKLTGVCGGYNIIIKTTDGGISWNALNAGILPATQITGIKYIDSNKIYAAGNSPSGDFYFSNDGGNYWQRNSLGLQYIFGGSVDLVRAMDFENADSGCIVTDLGTILLTTDRGSSWIADSSQRFGYLKTEIFKDVFYYDNQNILFSGNGGRVLKMTGSGKDLINLSGNNNNFYDSYITDKCGIYCAGDSGLIIRKKAGSPEWEKIFISKDIILNSVTFSDPLTGFVCSNKGRLFRTTDGGASWIEISIPIKRMTVNKILFKDKYSGFITGGIENSDKGIILNTTDGGLNWKINFQNPGEGMFRDIYFKDYMTGVAVGGNGSTAISNDGGVSWSIKNLTPYDLQAVIFNRSGMGIITGENGVIFRTSDGGKSWHYISPIQYKNLNSVIFTDDLNVISAGNKGTLIHSEDAGVSWQKINLITNNNILSLNYDGAGIYAFGENGSILYSEKDIIRQTTGIYKDKNNVKNNSSLTSYPNPFNPVTRISFSIPEHGFVNIKVYNILGKETGILLNDIRKEGIYHIEFNGSELPGGIYLCRMEFKNTAMIKRLILLK